MTIVSRPVDGATSADISSIPYTVGWTRAAIAVHSMLQIPVPMFLRLEADEHPPLVIDFRHHAFEWAVETGDFPVHPLEVLVETEATTAEAAPLFSLPGRNLDSLLWHIGLHSFAGMAASWLRPADRYKLTRWPNLTEHAHTLTQMRMTAMLGNVFLTADELAVAAGVELDEAQSLLNAFSLMGILQTSGQELPVTPVVEAVPQRGLFDRLRERLGL
jgi:hypothetical protein